MLRTRAATKVEQGKCLAHILSLFDQYEDSPFTLYLQQFPCTKVEDLVTMPHYDVNDLTYVPPLKPDDDLTGNTAISLQEGYKAHIRIFQGYVTYRNDIGEPIDED